MKQIIFTLTIILFIISCKSTNYNMVGDQFDHKKPLQLHEALQNLSDKEIVIEADVSAVCQAKGCWMTLVDSKASDEVFVKFKDYGFFMPLDLAGSRVIARGVLSKTSTGVEELRHYAEDAGKSKEEIMKITEPVEEYKLMASGVAIIQ